MKFEKSEITMDYGNVPARRQSCSEESSGETAAVNGMKLLRVVAVSFGLLCVLQAALNISLRLCRDISDNVGPDLKPSGQNLTEREQNNFENYFQEGWVYFYTSFYYISSTKRTWQNSREDCLHRGADLVIINSKQEQEFMRKLHREMWIGLTWDRRQDEWAWVDGSLLTQSYWGPGEPNNYRGKKEDCAEINHYENKNCWNDRQCEDQNFWICEKTVAL